MSKGTIFITGAGGLIGRALSQTLVSHYAGIWFGEQLRDFNSRSTPVLRNRSI